MQKTITYLSFALASVMVFLLFLTAKTYDQVLVAVILYPAVACLALNIFPRRTRKITTLSVKITSTPVSPKMLKQIDEDEINDAAVADADRRAFFKLIGTAGLSFFIFSLISRRAELPFFGRLAGGVSQTGVVNTVGEKIDPSERQPLDGYQIAEIDDSVVSYYGFSNKDGAWVIMREDTDSNSFRYAKGSDSFGSNWGRRELLNYKYFHDAF